MLESVETQLQDRAVVGVLGKASNCSEFS